MVSKLSERQKRMIKDLYFFSRPVNLIPGIDKRGSCFYNSFRRSYHLLIKRGLLEKCNEGKYLKVIGITPTGKQIAEKLIFNDNAGFIANGYNLLTALKIITKKNWWVFLHIIIKNGNVTVETLDKYKRPRVSFKLSKLFSKVKGNNEIVVRTHDIRELKRHIKKCIYYHRIAISIKKQDNITWLDIQTLDDSWDYIGWRPEEFIPKIVQSGGRCTGDVLEQTRI